MNLGESSVTYALAALLGASPCWAQQASPQDVSGQPASEMPRVYVKLADSAGEIRGRLLRLDSQTLSIQVDQGTVDLPLERVLRVERKVHDSLWNGAIIAAVYVAACAIWWCGQGLDEPTSVPRDAFLGIAMGGLVGAGIDALLYRRATIFDAGAPDRSRLPIAGVAVSFRF